ncbi:hypothetical protein VTO42DRAFT_7528 [Malbranchea cinnamomea]
MSTLETSSNWDFTPVINLLHTFRFDGLPRSSDPLLLATQNLSKDIHPLDTEHKSSDVDGYRRLGDFTAVWDYLAKASLSGQGRISAKAEIRLGVQSPRKNDKRSDTSLEHVREQKKAPSTKILLLREEKVGENYKSVEHPVTHASKSLSVHPVGNTGDASAKAASSPTKPIHLSPKRPSDDLASPPSPSGLKNLLSVSKPRFRVEPVLAGSAEEKKLELIWKLRERCPNERKYLMNPKLPDPAFARLNTSTRGIHVFVDVSNIMVGFHDTIKSARNIPLTFRVPRLPLSFHNFSLVLERGRPVSKRVLVGSDRFSAIDEAERLGYETNILERVQKAKEAPRKKKFVNGDKAHDQSSESETNAGPMLQRWVEQAVDEIVHLKMLESIVDTAEPSTIVLATGDAAEAEYSGGFMRMVERALEKGWRVELVSFTSTTSRAYTRKEFRAKWSSRFVIVQLDTYVEYLLDMHH